MGADQGAQPAGQVGTALAPVQAGAAHGPARAAVQGGGSLQAQASEHGGGPVRGAAALLAIELDGALFQQVVGHRHAQAACQMVVAGARHAQRRIARPRSHGARRDGRGAHGELHQSFE